MEYKEIDNFKIPVLGLGTWQIGGEIEADYRNDLRDIELIQKAIERGLTHIDTAELYGAGHCEEVIGEAIKKFDREKLFITTKVRNIHLAYEDIIKAIDGSLKRLQTAYVDLYLIHSSNKEIPLSETMRAMDELVDQGKTKFIGVSNFSVEQLKEAQKYSKNKIVANQIEYNLITRNNGENNSNVESEIIPYCQKNEVMVIAYRPLAKGKIVDSQNVLLQELAEKYSKTKSQIALNWLISKNNIITIPGSKSHEQLEENLGAVGWKLSDEDMKLLDETKFE
jgi:diketogulonate reductase-like aldo/keto reductase